MNVPAAFAPYVLAKPATPRRLFAGVAAGATVFLKFADRAEMDAAFALAGIVAAEGQSLPPDFSWNGIGHVSIIGTITNNDAVFDDAGNMAAPPTARPGWHVNLLPA